MLLEQGLISHYRPIPATFLDCGFSRGKFFRKANARERMKPQNGIILVSGASGSIGSAVMRRMAGRFEGIVGFDQKAPKVPSPGCLYVPVDVA